MDYITKLQGTLVFVQLRNAVDCWDKAKGKEWKAAIVVDEDTADAWDEQFPKQPAKAVKTAEFAGIYHTEPPLPSEKKQYVITLRKNTILGNGNPVPEMYRPKVLDADKVDITATTDIGNGSLGVMSVDLWDSPKGMVARLKNILVTDLVEYEGKEYNAGDEFDDDAAETPKAKPAKEVAKPKAKPAVKKAAPAETSSADQPNEEDDPF